VTQLPWETQIDRRGFLGAAVMAGAALATTSCAELARTMAKISSDPCEDARAHKGDVNGLAISPDGKWLASGSDDNTIKLWSLPDGSLVKTLAGHRGEIFGNGVVNSVAIAADGKLLASGSQDDTIKLWSLPDG
jgi:WD40 repeat protein